MSLRDDIKKIWLESFDDSREYVDMYFDRVYRDVDVVATMLSGHAVSSLLLQRYVMDFHSHEVGVSYVAGAATRRQMRGKGLMSALMTRALAESLERGDMMCALIPASEWLYMFYERFGFATVFYVDTQRYTSLHSFSSPDLSESFDSRYRIVDDIFDERVWLAFDGMQHRRPGMILHSHRDFLNILDDLRMDHGRFVAIADTTGAVVSMAWAVADETEPDGMVVVKELLSEDYEAGLAALRGLREHFPGRPFKILASVGDGSRKLYPRGMGRIVNVKYCLDVIAMANPELRLTVRVYDPILAVNNNTFIVEGGSVRVDPSVDKHLDLDIDISTFTRLVFSSPHIGNIIGLPSERPHISLMLD